MQDIILFILSLIVSSSLITSIIGVNKPEKSTCVTSTVALTGTALVLYTMALPLAAIASLVGAVLWLVLFAQKRGK